MFSLIQIDTSLPLKVAGVANVFFPQQHPLALIALNITEYKMPFSDNQSSHTPVA